MLVIVIVLHHRTRVCVWLEYCVRARTLSECHFAAELRDGGHQGLAVGYLVFAAALYCDHEDRYATAWP